MIRICKEDCMKGEELNSRLILSFDSPATPVTNFVLYGGMGSTTEKCTRNINGPSNTLSHNRCYGVQPIYDSHDHRSDATWSGYKLTWVHGKRALLENQRTENG